MATVVAIWAGSRLVQRISLGAGLIIAAAVAVIAFNSMSQSVDSGVLAPARESSQDSLCTQPLDSALKGDVSPLFCSDGSINKLAWSLIATNSPQVMTLGHNASPKQVRAAVVQDLQSRMSGAQECSAVLLSAAYYGWTFHIAPVAGLTLDCPIVL